MNWIIYLYANSERRGIIVGLTKNIVQTATEFKKLNALTLHFQHTGKYLNRLVWAEIADDEKQGRAKMEEITRYTLMQKWALIETNNPDYLDLTKTTDILNY